MVAVAFEYVEEALKCGDLSELSSRSFHLIDSKYYSVFY